VWTNGDNVNVAPKQVDASHIGAQQPVMTKTAEVTDDLPF